MRTRDYMSSLKSATTPYLKIYEIIILIRIVQLIYGEKSGYHHNEQIKQLGYV